MYSPKFLNYCRLLSLYEGTGFVWKDKTGTFGNIIVILMGYGRFLYC